jgi:hypothetical protein
VRYIRKKANPRVRERNDKECHVYWDNVLEHAKKDYPNFRKKAVLRKIRRRADVVSFVEDVLPLIDKEPS